MNCICGACLTKLELSCWFCHMRHLGGLNKPCDCYYDENGDRWYCEDCQYEDEEDMSNES
jgi:hypothetical protein